MTIEAIMERVAVAVAGDRAMYADERTGDQPLEDEIRALLARRGLATEEDHDGDLIVVAVDRETVDEDGMPSRC